MADYRRYEIGELVYAKSHWGEVTGMRYDPFFKQYIYRIATADGDMLVNQEDILND